MFPTLDSFATSFTKLELASKTDEPFGSETMFAIFLRILFRMLTFLEQDCLEEKPLSAPFEKAKNISHIRASEETLQKIDHILNHTFTTSVTAAQVSKQVYLSERQINRYIESQYSQTFQQRKTYLRINAACKLLISTDLAIADISKQVGYTSINTFYSAFKQQLGMTPNEFRIKISIETRPKAYN